MSITTFDTLDFVNQLKKTGINPLHAEAEAKAISKAITETTNNSLATKKDLWFIKQKISLLHKDMKALKTQVSQDVKTLESKLTIRLGSMMAASVTILATLLVILHI